MLLFVLVTALVLLGALRDFIFVNINFQLDFLWRDLAASKTHSMFEFLNNFSYWEIYYAKFGLTGLFSLIYLVATLLVIRLMFTVKKYRKYTIYLFGGIFLISLLLFGGGYLFGNPHFGYDLARNFMGIIQSPIPAMILVPIFTLMGGNVFQQKTQEK